MDSWKVRGCFDWDAWWDCVRRYPEQPYSKQQARSTPVAGMGDDYWRMQRQAADRMREMQARRARAIDILLRRWCRAGRQASSGVEGRHEE